MLRVLGHHTYMNVPYINDPKIPYSTFSHLMFTKTRMVLKVPLFVS